MKTRPFYPPWSVLCSLTLPLLGTERLAAGMPFETLRPRLVVIGEPGTTCTLQCMAGLGSGGAWSTLAQRVLEEGPWVHLDQETADGGIRFYQVMTADAPAPTLKAEAVWVGPTGIPNPNPARLVWLPPGSFPMGSPSSERGRRPSEGPQTQVTLTEGFWMGKYEVTQGEYAAVMGGNPSRYLGDLHRPVEQVSWHNAVAYCEALTRQERSASRLPAGYEYRLPTEAQWEYACRAGTTTRFSFGDALGCSDFCDFSAELDRYLVWCGNDGRQEEGRGSRLPDPGDGTANGQTERVGRRLPNPWGLHGMHGNVWEWCADWWSAGLPGGSVTDPTGPKAGSDRVLRGGGWDDVATFCRSAFRGGTGPSRADDSFGFRVALVPVP